MKAAISTKLLVAVGALAVTLGGCLPTTTFSCTTDTDCGPGGVCEAVRYCSFVDPSCDEGRRYGEVSGAYTHQCIGMGTDGGIGDRDGDGVLDGADKCPATYDPDQGNEDGDRFGDVCDPCPPVSDADPIVDPDGDNVSDVCDPNPTVAGDAIFLFDGFHSSISSTWPQVGTWSNMDDDAYADAPTGMPYYLAPNSPATNNETISTVATIVAAPGTGSRGIGLIAQHQPGTDTAIQCGPHLSGGGGANELQVWETSPYNSLASAALPFTIGETYAITMKRTGTFYTCGAVSGTTQSVNASSSFSGGASRGAGFRHYGVTARYKWLMIVSSP